MTRAQTWKDSFNTATRNLNMKYTLHPVFENKHYKINASMVIVLKHVAGPATCPAHPTEQTHHDTVSSLVAILICLQWVLGKDKTIDKMDAQNTTDSLLTQIYFLNLSHRCHHLLRFFWIGSYQGKPEGALVVANTGES